jgi:hypothetical protein
LLGEPWILDADAATKTLCGHQEGAEVGYYNRSAGCQYYDEFNMDGRALNFNAVDNDILMSSQENILGVKVECIENCVMLQILR